MKTMMVREIRSNQEVYVYVDFLEVIIGRRATCMYIKGWIDNQWISLYVVFDGWMDESKGINQVLK